MNWRIDHLFICEKNNLIGENAELLAEIKEGLVAGVKCRELMPGTTFWFRRLNEYGLVNVSVHLSMG